MKINKNNSAFTIIETLVAITILMIAIAGPLSVSGKALTAAIDAKNTLIATYLAQETIEYINFLKDVSYNYNEDPLKNKLSICTDSSPCGASPKHDDPVQGMASNIKKCNNVAGEFGKCELYLASDGYSYKNTGTPTPFTRSFYTTGGGDSTLLTVVVTWRAGSLVHDVKLQQMLTFTSRFGI